MHLIHCKNAAALSFHFLIHVKRGQVIDTMHLSKVDHLFRMLKVNFVFVNGASGRLAGVISRSILRAHLSSLKKPQNLRWAYHMSPSLDLRRSIDDGIEFENL